MFSRTNKPLFNSERNFSLSIPNPEELIGISFDMKKYCFLCFSKNKEILFSNIVSGKDRLEFSTHTRYSQRCVGASVFLVTLVLNMGGS